MKLPLCPQMVLGYFISNKSRYVFRLFFCLLIILKKILQRQLIMILDADEHHLRNVRGGGVMQPSHNRYKNGMHLESEFQDEIWYE